MALFPLPLATLPPYSYNSLTHWRGAQIPRCLAGSRDGMACHFCHLLLPERPLAPRRCVCVRVCACVSSCVSCHMYIPYNTASPSPQNTTTGYRRHTVRASPWLLRATDKHIGRDSCG